MGISRNSSIVIDKDIKDELKNISEAIGMNRKNLTEECINWCIQDTYIIKAIKRKYEIKQRAIRRSKIESFRKFKNGGI